MNKRKTTIFLAVMLALIACGSKNNGDSSRENKITRTPSHDTQQPSNVSADTSEVESQSSDSSQKQSSSPSIEQSSSSSQSSEHSSQNQSSSEDPISSSSEPSSSSEDPISSSSEPSSSSVPIEEPFEYDSYLKKHAEGQTVEYVFEAECTNLGGKEGPGYSGATSEQGMAVYDAESGRACVTYLYAKGCSLNFFIVSDRDVNNAEMSLNLAGEFILVDLNPSKYQIRVDYPDSKYLEPAETSVDGALGYWDALFLSEFKDPAVNGGYYVDPWTCGTIEIDAYEESTIVGWDEFKITSSLRLKKGITCISLITANSEAVNMGTMAANAPVVDNMIIKTNAQLGMFDEQDNSQGDVGCHIR